MAKPTNPLRNMLREVVNEMASGDGGRASDVADTIIERCPADFEEQCRHLGRAALIEWARNEFNKRAGVSAAARAGVPMLPGFEASNLPGSICIPAPDGDTLYRPIAKASIGELRAAITRRVKQAEEDAAVLRQLMDLLHFREAQGATDVDPVFPPADSPANTRAA